MPALGPSERSNTLGRYEIVAPIGRGGMAEVHLAVQRGPGGFEKLVVIKVVHDNLESDPAFVEMLFDEARHAALIRHPNVVEIYDLGEEAGRHFIAMEYLEGEPLLDVLRIATESGARLDPLSIARVIADTAAGLDAAHRLRSRDGRPIELVHHDVSLGNIVVLYTGLVKLVDFGVAKAQSATRGGRVHGKLGYMAPEKVQALPVDRRSDIWSLGCVLWEALTLQRLFKGDSDIETARLVLGAEIQPPSTVDASVPPELDRIVMRALERDPSRRYQTAKEMADDIEEVLRELKYGAKNDRIARYMESVFAARIAAREGVLRELSSTRRPSAEVLGAAFGEAPAPAPAPGAPAVPAPTSAAAPASKVPAAVKVDEDSQPEDQDSMHDDSVQETTAVEDLPEPTLPPATTAKPPPAAKAAAATAAAAAKTAPPPAATATAAKPAPAPAAAAAKPAATAAAAQPAPAKPAPAAEDLEDAWSEVGDAWSTSAPPPDASAKAAPEPVQPARTATKTAPPPATAGRPPTKTAPPPGAPAEPAPEGARTTTKTAPPPAAAATAPEPARTATKTAPPPAAGRPPTKTAPLPGAPAEPAPEGARTTTKTTLPPAATAAAPEPARAATKTAPLPPAAAPPPARPPAKTAPPPGAPAQATPEGARTTTKTTLPPAAMKAPAAPRTPSKTAPPPAAAAAAAAPPARDTSARVAALAAAAESAAHAEPQRPRTPTLPLTRSQPEATRPPADGVPAPRARSETSAPHPRRRTTTTSAPPIPAVAAAVLGPSLEARPLSPSAFGQHPRQTGAFEIGKLLPEGEPEAPEEAEPGERQVRRPAPTPTVLSPVPPAGLSPGPQAAKPPGPGPGLRPTPVPPSASPSPSASPHATLPGPVPAVRATPEPADREPSDIAPPTLLVDDPDLIADEEPTRGAAPARVPAWDGEPPPVVPSLRGGDDGANPFADEDDFKTVADVIPASPEASRSLQSEPSWTVARQSAALGELQRWVQESRTPPQARWESVSDEVPPLHQRITGWAQKRGLPRWSPYASIAVVLVWLVVLLAKCTGGHASKPAPAPAPSSTQGDAPAGGDAPRPRR